MAESVHALERQVESLRARLEEYETARVASGASAAAAPAAVVKAFDDPAVQARLKEAMGKARQERVEQAFGNEPLEGFVGSFIGHHDPLKNLALNDAQKGALEPVLKGSRERIDAIAEEARKGAKNREQANAEIARERAQTDAQAAALLTAEQAAKYLDSRKPRGSVFRSGADGKSSGGATDGLGHLVEIKEPPKLPKLSGMPVFEMQMQELPGMILEESEAPSAP